MRNKDNKKNDKGIIELRNFFYTKVLNDILMGLSICNTIEELDNDSNNEYISNIYLYEAVYYFKVANEEMEQKNFIETENSNREKYTEFLEVLNESFLIEVFTVCIEKLEYLRTKSTDFNDHKLLDYIDNIEREFNIYIENINRQVEHV